MSDKLFRAILADPPYHYATWSAKGTGRSPVSHYDTMSIDEIVAWFEGHRDLIARDAVLFLWVPGPHTFATPKLMEALGFTPKGSGFVWVKHNRAKPPCKECGMPGRPIGNGFGTRKNAEFCWIGTRGKPGRARDASVREVIDWPIVVDEPRGQHSQKPDHIIRPGIERMFPGPYLELFARTTAPGWTSLGDEVGLLDHGSVKTRRQPSNLAGV